MQKSSTRSMPPIIRRVTDIIIIEWSIIMWLYIILDKFCFNRKNTCSISNSSAKANSLGLRASLSNLCRLSSYSFVSSAISRSLLQNGKVRFCLIEILNDKTKWCVIFCLVVSFNLLSLVLNNGKKNHSYLCYHEKWQAFVY